MMALWGFVRRISGVWEEMGLGGKGGGDGEMEEEGEGWGGGSRARTVLYGLREVVL